MAKDDDAKATAHLPIMSMDLHFEYEDDSADLAVAADLLMDVNPDLRKVTLRIEYAAGEGFTLADDFRNTRRENESLHDVLGPPIRVLFHLFF